jgi:hypothetical protein
MTKLEDFDLNELMLFIVGVLTALGGLIAVTQKSKCESCCWGCMKRDVDAVIKDEKLKTRGYVGDTPRLSTDNNEEERP